MIGFARPAAGAPRSQWYKFRIAEALGPGQHEVRVVSPGPPVRVTVYGTEYDDADRPGGVIEALHPDLDGIGWGDIWEAVRRQHPARSPIRAATEGEYEPVKDSIATFGVLQPVVADENGSVLAGRLRKRVCTELGVPCPTQVITGLTEEQKEQLAIELEFCRKHLSLDDKRETAKLLLKLSPRSPDRVVGKACGLDHKTVGRLREGLEEAGEIPQVESRVGADGKTYKFPRIIANTPNELETACRVIEDLPGNCAGKTLDLTTASRRARRNRARQERANVVVQQLPNDSIRLYHCGFQELERVAELQPASVKLVLTDIPYEQDFLPQVDGLAQLAERLLVEGGLLVMYMGQAYLNRVMASLDEYLSYRWTLAFVWGGDANVFHTYQVVSQWKPVLVYSKGAWQRRERWPDVIRGTGKEKTWHEWQQPLDELELLVSYFSRPGDLVVDPCGGGFTTAEACLRLGRRCVACDIDGGCVAKGLQRLEDARQGLQQTTG